MSLLKKIKCCSRSDGVYLTGIKIEKPVSPSHIRVVPGNECGIIYDPVSDIVVVIAIVDVISPHSRHHTVLPVRVLVDVYWIFIYWRIILNESVIAYLSQLEILALFVRRKLILQTRMRSYPVGLDLWFWLDPSSTFILYVSEQRRFWRDWADAQAHLSLRWSPMW